MSNSPATTEYAAANTGPAIRRGHAQGTVLRRAMRRRSAQVGVVLLGGILVAVVVGPWVAPYSATESPGAPFSGPSLSHPFGLDYLGRDVLSRFLFGGRSVIALATLSTVFGVAGGVAIGLVSAYRRDWVDGMLMRLADVVLAFPSILLVLLLLAIVGPSVPLMVGSIALVHAVRVARVVRAAGLEIAVQPFVESAEARGVPSLRIMFEEILPNTWTPILVEFGVRLSYSIIMIASLSFLGFGLQPPSADWGLMVAENRTGLNIQPWAAGAPIIALGLLAVAVNLIGDAFARTVGRTLDPKEQVL